MKLLRVLNNNPFFNAVRSIKALLDVDQKRKAIIMFLLLLANAGFDVLGISLILPIIKVALQPSLVQTDVYVNWIYQWMGIEDAMQFLLVLSVLLLLVFLLKNAFSLFILYIQSRFAFNISLRLNKKQFLHYYQEGFLYIKDKDSGEKTYDIITIPFYFAAVYIIQTLIISTELVVVLLMFVGMLFYDYRLVLLLLLVVIPAFGLIYLLTKNKVKKLGDERNKLYPKSYALVLESMAAFVNVKLSNKENTYLNNYIDLQDEINKIDVLRLGVYNRIHQKANEIIAALGIIVIFLFAVLFPNSGSSLITVLALFGVAAFRMMPSINRIMGALLDLKNHSYVIEKLQHLRGKDIATISETKKMSFEETVDFQNIEFKYGGKDTWAIADINLRIKKGETVGFIGQSGSGKTTLLNIFMRLLRETKGTILVDGQSITPENESAFQKNIGYVQQEVFIKNGSILENIAFGEDVASINIDKINEVIKHAKLRDFISQQENGLDTILGERGANLSGGQKQRIGIARALYKESEILVFDEATSALDMEMENAISETINNLTTLGKTVLIIAHRITTLSNCDRIYELRNGQLHNVYSYEDLHKERFNTV